MHNIVSNLPKIIISSIFKALKIVISRKNDQIELKDNSNLNNCD